MKGLGVGGELEGFLQATSRLPSSHAPNHHYIQKLEVQLHGATSHAIRGSTFGHKPTNKCITKNANKLNSASGRNEANLQHGLGAAEEILPLLALPGGVERLHLVDERLLDVLAARVPLLHQPGLVLLCSGTPHGAPDTIVWQHHFLLKRLRQAVQKDNSPGI